MRFEQKQGSKYYGEKMGGLVFFAFIAVYITISSIGSLLFSAISIGDVAKKAISCLFSVVSMLIIIKLFSYERKEKITLTAYLEKFNPVYVIFAVILAFGMIFGFGYANDLVIRYVIVPLKLKVPVIEAPPMNNVFQFLLFVFLIGLVAPFEEECFFRGLLLGNLTKGRKISGILTVAFCFALYHGTMIQFLYQFIFGIFLTVLTIKARSVVPSIIAHSINNIFILTVTYFNIVIDPYNPWLIIFGLLLIVAFLVLLYVFHKKEPDEFTNTQGGKIEKLKKFYFPYGVFGIGLCLINVILSVII